MNKKIYGALKRIIQEVKEKRNATCLMKDCIINDIIGGDDIDIAENWINEIVKDVESNVINVELNVIQD